VEAVGDRDDDVREEAIEAIWRVARGTDRDGSSPANARVVVRALREGLEREDGRFRRRILDVLETAAPAVPDALELIARMARTDENARLRAAAVDALGDLGREWARERPVLVSRILDPVAAALEDGDSEVRREAADALGDLEAAAGSAIPALRAALGHEDDSTRRRVVEALGQIGRRLDRVPDGLVADLAKVLRDPDADVRENAAEALGDLGAAAAEVADDLRRAKDDPDEGVRRAAERALRRVERDECDD